MSNPNTILCTCFKCKKNDKDNIGNYVHPSTKWRHSKKVKNHYYNELNYDGDDDSEEGVGYNRY